MARHAFLTQRVKAFQFVKGQNPDTTTMSHNSNLTWNRAWSAATVTSFAMGFERVHTLIVPEKNNLGPQIVVSNALTAINPQNSVPIDRVENKFRYSGNWRQVRGRHQLTAGFLVMRRQFNGYEGDAQLGGCNLITIWVMMRSRICGWVCRCSITRRLRFCLCSGAFGTGIASSMPGMCGRRTGS